MQNLGACSFWEGRSNTLIKDSSNGPGPAQSIVGVVVQTQFVRHASLVIMSFGFGVMSCRAIMYIIIAGLSIPEPDPALLTGATHKPSPDLQPFIPLRNLPNWSWQQRTWIMGILNITPDSFSDGGQLQGVKGAVSHACHMVQQGAHILDVGGQSTRPGATRLTTEEELQRVIPVIRCHFSYCCLAMRSVHGQLSKAPFLKPCVRCFLASPVHQSSTPFFAVGGSHMFLLGQVYQQMQYPCRPYQTQARCAVQMQTISKPMNRLHLHSSTVLLYGFVHWCRTIAKSYIPLTQ